jgi:hypothetical protein
VKETRTIICIKSGKRKSGEGGRDREDNGKEKEEEGREGGTGTYKYISRLQMPVNNLADVMEPSHALRCISG